MEKSFVREIWRKATKLSSLKTISGEVTILGDKSISHRCIILGSLAEGESSFENILISGDTAATIEIFRSLGVNIDLIDENIIKIHGVGLNGLDEPKHDLDAKSSGTTARLLIGLLSRQNFSSRMVGSNQLMKRPMARVIDLFTDNGAKIDSDKGNLPITFTPSSYTFNNLDTKVPSAQVKSAVILSSLYNNEPTIINEETLTRDHTERMLLEMGIELVRLGNTITIPPVSKLNPLNMKVPSDISSAAFLISLGVLKGENLLLKNVLINERRLGFVKVLKRMNANIEILNIKEISNELVGDIKVSKSDLVATTIEPKEIPDIIDEIPILTFIASQAEGKTILKGANELRIKESDRLENMKNFIQGLKGDITMYEDGFAINGVQDLDEGNVITEDDHRVAMTAIIANIALGKKILPDNTDCIKDSYPTFFLDIESIGGMINE